MRGRRQRRAASICRREAVRLISKARFVAKNIAGSAADILSGNSVTAKTSLIGVGNDGFALINNGGNLLGSKAAPLNPQLAPLANNAGDADDGAAPRQPCDQRRKANPASLTFDQRGTDSTGRSVRRTLGL